MTAVPSGPQGIWELLARCREIAVQLRDIGEESHADDIESLVVLYVEAEGGGWPPSRTTSKEAQ